MAQSEAMVERPQANTTGTPGPSIGRHRGVRPAILALVIIAALLSAGLRALADPGGDTGASPRSPGATSGDAGPVAGLVAALQAIGYTCGAYLGTGASCAMPEDEAMGGALTIEAEGTGAAHRLFARIDLHGTPDATDQAQAAERLAEVAGLAVAPPDTERAASWVEATVLGDVDDCGCRRDLGSGSLVVGGRSLSWFTLEVTLR